ncbi:MAG: adenylate kinase [Anaerolineae bacterium]|nr:adenylate kinase [Anaerolineae bacterium]
MALLACFAVQTEKLRVSVTLRQIIFMSLFPYQRIVVIGTTSSGKSTLAEQVAKRLNLNFIELDALHWEPDWQEAPLEVFRARVETATKAERWIVAGNYHVVRDLIWHKAEAVIWLDYSFWRIFRQLTRRTFSRWWTQELLWGTNREPLWVHLKIWSQESLFHWLFKTYWRRKRETPELLALPEHQHLKVFQFKHPREADEWMEKL